LVEERANCNFNQEELASFSDLLHKHKKDFLELWASMPETRNHDEFIQMSIEEK
jgi:hypothetical protein